jgi:hypothetical protein
MESSAVLPFPVAAMVVAVMWVEWRELLFHRVAAEDEEGKRQERKKRREDRLTRRRLRAGVASGR